MKKKLVCLGLFLVIIVSVLLGCVGATYAEVGTNFANNKIVRVGMLNMQPMLYYDENGKEAGYDYDYLMEIAKYTGWKYEFVPYIGSGADARLFADLQSGVIDVYGSATKSTYTTQRFSFAEFSEGVTYTTINVLKGEDRFSSFDISTLNEGCKIGAVNTNTASIQGLKAYLEANGLHPEVVEGYENSEALLAALKSGEVDAMLSKDVINVPDTNILIRFSPQEFYFITAKGNDEIIRGLNTAMLNILNFEPLLQKQLTEKHYSYSHYNELVLSKDEKAYIASLAPIKIASGVNIKPLEYFDDNGKFTGLTADVLSELTNRTGVKFEIQPYDTVNDAVNAVRNGNADIVTGLYKDSDKDLDAELNYFMPFLNIPIVMVRNTKTDMAADNLKMSYSGYFNLSSNNETNLRIKYDTYAMAISAVNTRKVDYCYGNVYSTDYYRSTLNLNNLVITATGYTMPFSMAAGSYDDTFIISTLNKAIASISSDTMNEYVVSNITKLDNSSTFGDYLRNNPWIIVCIVVLGVLLIAIVVLLFVLYKQKITKTFGTKYRTLANIAEEILFDYDIKKDKLVFNSPEGFRFGLQVETERFLQKFNNGEFPQIEFEGGTELKDGDGDKYEKLMHYIAADGSVSHYKMVVVMLPSVSSSKSNSTQIVGRIINVEKDIVEKQTLIDLASKDALTGIYNNKTFHEIVNNVLTHQPELKHAMMIIDVDDFKQINDEYGHMQGDKILKWIASAISGSLRNDDVAARVGGDEFAVFMRNYKDRDNIEQLAERILHNFEKLSKDSGITVSCSLGVAMYPDNAVNFDELYKIADSAMYEIKRSSKHDYKISGDKHNKE